MFFWTEIIAWYTAEREISLRSKNILMPGEVRISFYKGYDLTELLTWTSSLHWQDFRFDGQWKGNLSKWLFSCFPHCPKDIVSTHSEGLGEDSASGPLSLKIPGPKMSQNHCEVSGFYPGEQLLKYTKNCYSLLKFFLCKILISFLLQKMIPTHTPDLHL